MMSLMAWTLMDPCELTRIGSPGLSFTFLSITVMQKKEKYNQISGNTVGNVTSKLFAYFI